MCHKGNTICVSLSAVKGHLKHGDKLGDCATCHTVDQAAASRSLGQVVEEGTNTVAGAYPNPNNGRFNLQLKGATSGKAEVLVTNANGVVVERRNVLLTGKGQTLSFNLQNEATGLYIVKVINEDGVQAMKVVIQR
ncbi:MAG: T9SS type A sorting domain-containing protein [Segetibacter sp.]